MLAFDRALLTSITTYHEGALSTARTELSIGSHPEAEVTAPQIVDVQQTEISQMRQLLTQL